MEDYIQKESGILLYGGFDPAYLKLYEERGHDATGLLQRLVLSKQDSYSKCR